MIILVNGLNPELSVVTSLGNIPADEKVNLNEINFRMAFVVEGFANRKRKADPRYVKYISRLWSETDGIQSFKHIPMRECTDEDLSQFYEVESNSKQKYDSIYRDPNHGFFCIDWVKEELDLWGNLGKTYDYQNLDVLLVPCNLLLPDLGFTKETIREDCIADERIQKEYLGPLNILMLVNDEVFVED